MLRSWMMSLLLVLAAPAVLAQSWSQAYDKGLAEGRAGRWAEARQAFKQAAAYRTEDIAGSTTLPGPVTERRLWRSGSPYSPNFLAAYCSFRVGSGLSGSGRAEQFRAAAAEFEALQAKGQLSPESFYFLNFIYTSLGDTEKRIKLDERFGASRNQITWKVDTEIVAPEEIGAVQELMGQRAPVIVTPPSNPVTNPPNNPNVRPTNPPANPTTTPPSLGTRVPSVATKFALIVGNAASRIQGQAMPFASDDAQKVREALVMSAGYPEENVDVVINATASQILASARALADRLPQDGTMFIYFAGAGVNIDGKDFLAGVDTELTTDTNSMVAKAALYQLFERKGAHIFSFFQVNRPTVNGRYFGMEVPLYGRIAQCQATLPNGSVYSLVSNGRPVGMYTEAFVATLNEFRTNQIPIMEFGWQLFYRIRRGGTGSDAGSSRQTPTLPVLTNLATDAVF